MQKTLDFFRRHIIPKPIFEFFQPTYHYLLALIGAIIYRFPSNKLIVVGVTGTKGKTTTVEFLNAIFEASGKKTAVLSTLHFKIGDKDERNLFKMTMPGRFFVQKFLREAVVSGCEVAIIEMTSEGAKQYRHKFIDLDALVFLNLAPEHIESHGSYENYVEAKLSIAKELEGKPDSAIIVNKDDKEAEKFLALNIKNKIPYSLSDAFNIQGDPNGSSFQVDKTIFYMKLPGLFNVSNALSAIACARHFGIEMSAIKKGLESVEKVRGRVEKINVGQPFEVVVDYAHTPESLKAIYEVYGSTSSPQVKHERKLICVLGNTGGGRDKWKRPEMGKIADEYCSEIILTNEDPYDEDPMKILEEMRVGIKNKLAPTPGGRSPDQSVGVEIILDRREAIRFALNKAGTLRPFETSQDKQAQGAGNQNKAVVLITGKGTDPYIMGANGKKTPWDDANVVREELIKLLGSS